MCHGNMCHGNTRQGENRKTEQFFRKPRPLSSTCGEPRSSLQVIISVSHGPSVLFVSTETTQDWGQPAVDLA